MDTATGTIAPVIGLVTLQFLSGGLFDGKPVDDYAVHLITATTKGTPGPTLCGLDRFHKDSTGCPGRSVQAPRSHRVCKVFGVTSSSVVTCVPRSGGRRR
jgi:hypothetical protein